MNYKLHTIRVSNIFTVRLSQSHRSDVKDFRPPALALGLSPLLLAGRSGKLLAFSLGLALDLISVVLDTTGSTLGGSGGSVRLASDGVSLGVPSGTFGLSGKEL